MLLNTYTDSIDFNAVTGWVHDTLNAWLPSWGATLVECVLIGLCLLLLYAVIALALIYVERKVCAFFQCRLGPNRVGPYGTVQSVADMIKMLIKELIPINHIDRFLFNLAPFVVIISSVLAFGCLPFGKGLEVLDFNVGIFFLMAVSSIGIVGILLAGWSSNNKYSLIGAMRSGAQMISYELSIGLAIMTMVVFAGTMQNTASGAVSVGIVSVSACVGTSSSLAKQPSFTCCCRQVSSSATTLTAALSPKSATCGSLNAMCPFSPMPMHTMSQGCA